MKIRGLYFGYAERPIFRDWSHTFDARITAVMGPTGCGKSTLIRLIAGLETPESGTVGSPGKLGMVFQEDVFLPYSAGPEIRILTGAQPNRIQEMLKRLDIDDRQPIRSMSGGMKRKVAIARCLLQEANWLLMDEPFRGLDEQSRAQAIALIRDRLAGRRLLIATHRILDAQELEAELLLLRAGINEGGTDGQ